MQGNRMAPMAIALSASLAFGLLALGGCKSRAEEDIGTSEAPLVFVMTKSTTEGKEEAVETLRRALEEGSGLSIEIEIPDTPVRAIQLFGGRRADAGLLGPFEYLLARKLHEVEAGLQILREGPTYEGTILVREDSDLSTIADLHGKRMAYTDPYSLTGFVLPAARLKNAGVDVDALYAGTHDEALAMLEDGRAHAAATYLRRAEGELEAKSLRVLETIGPVANEPVFFRKGLGADKREALIRGFEAAVADEQCLAALMDLYGCDGVARVDDSAYDELERLASDAGQQVQSLVPGGWFVHHSAQEPLLPTP